MSVHACITISIWPWYNLVMFFLIQFVVIIVWETKQRIITTHRIMEEKKNITELDQGQILKVL